MAAAIRDNEPLAAQTVFKIGGPARFYAEAGNREDFIAVLRAARSLKLPWIILGSGSNLLVSDQGFDGLVVHWGGGAVEISGHRLYADAPVSMSRVVAEAITAGLCGFEWAIGVPGTIGGSVRGNAGCFGGEMKDVVEAVSVLNVERGEIEEWAGEAAEFSYRESIFKRRPELVILGARLALAPGDRQESQQAVQGFVARRLKSQDIGSQSAGCIFKNVLWERKGLDPEKLVTRFPELAEFRGRPAIPTGFLIERLGLKGRAVGGAKISERHGNFIINTGKARAEDVLMLIGIAKEYVHRKYGLLLEEEIQYVGFQVS